MNEILNLFEDKSPPATSICIPNNIHLQYLVCLTPRSGSSLLTELMHKTDIMGNPEEWFNPSDIMPINIQRHSLKSLADYLTFLMTNQVSANGVFGFEASYYQLHILMDALDLFNFMKKPFPVIYISRNDFLAQAVSLYKATETGYFQSTQGPAENDSSKHETNISYDNDKIKHWIMHVLHQEFCFEIFFQKHGISPLRISYESLVDSTEAIIRGIAEFLSLRLGSNYSLPITMHKKIGTKLNTKLVEKFKNSNPEFIHYWLKYRGHKNPLQEHRIK